MPCQDDRRSASATSPFVPSALTGRWSRSAPRPNDFLPRLGVDLRGAAVAAGARHLRERDHGAGQRVRETSRHPDLAVRACASTAAGAALRIHLPEPLHCPAADLPDRASTASTGRTRRGRSPRRSRAAAEAAPFRVRPPQSEPVASAPQMADAADTRRLEVTLDEVVALASGAASSSRRRRSTAASGSTYDYGHYGVLLQQQRQGRVVAGDGPRARRHRGARLGDPPAPAGLGGLRPPRGIHRSDGRLPHLQASLPGGQARGRAVRPQAVEAPGRVLRVRPDRARASST